MISINAAQLLAEKQTIPIAGTESVCLDAALGRVLAQDVLADMDQPAFDKSAMDGYACRMADLPGVLAVCQTLAAGVAADFAIEQGQCMRIFTGAPVPVGADCVVMQEHVMLLPNGNIKVNQQQVKSNICKQGEDVKIGDLLIGAGRRLKQADLAILTSAGVEKPLVYVKPTVGIVCTGSELAEMVEGEKPQGAFIRNTNIFQLKAQIEAVGGMPRYFGLVADNVDAMTEKLREALDVCQMVITTGGASVGDFDLVPKMIEELGGQVHFSGVAMQPGKPVVFATINGKPFWGLSGNPVSSFLQFEFIARHSLSKLCGIKTNGNNGMVQLVLEADLVRHKKGRDLLVPVALTDKGTVLPISFHGSAHVAALTNTYAFAVLPATTHEIKAGSTTFCLIV